MKLSKAKINDGRVFLNTECVFSGEKKMNTVSGKNGSGKTRLFQAIALIQKAYFAKTLIKNGYANYNGYEIKEWIDSEVIRLLPADDAYAEVALSFEKNDFEINNIVIPEDIGSVFEIEKRLTITVKLSRVSGDMIWEIEQNALSEKVLHLFWNLKDPCCLIIYVSAERKVHENDMLYDSIKLRKENSLSTKIDVVLGFDSLYDNMYRIMINDYIHERIIPSNPKRDAYVANSKIQFKSLLDSISVGNFSGIEKSNQFILTAKKEKSKRYDVREFSSGEKLIWYSLLLINYVQNMGILIIDEPENHLHESLAWSFSVFLQDICDNKIEEITLSEVFLITHSKNLIYNSFSMGTNYVIAESGEIRKLSYNNYESVLRNVGISYVNEKVLFVEGKSDLEMMSEIFSKYNIQLKPLGSCTEVIKTYEGVQRISAMMQDKSIAFMIDRDTRDLDEIESLRSSNIEYFDSHFVIMPKHEMENYLLDSPVIADVYNNLAMAMDIDPIEESEVNKVMRTFADESKQDTKKKYLNHLLHNELHLIDGLVNQRDIIVSTKDDFEEYINGVFSGESWDKVLDTMKSYYLIAEDKYNDTNWNSNWNSLCDGKRVYNQSINELAKKLGVKSDILSKKVKEKIVSSNEELISLVEEVSKLYT